MHIFFGNGEEKTGNQLKKSLVQTTRNLSKWTPYQ
uniref:Uncharacterized protein n=1 Tax=Rhizophora mucronata TaxID=61149 RepID=A0A2P2R301_RHIMU